MKRMPLTYRFKVYQSRLLLFTHERDAISLPIHLGEERLSHHVIITHKCIIENSLSTTPQLHDSHNHITFKVFIKHVHKHHGHTEFS